MTEDYAPRSPDLSLFAATPQATTNSSTSPNPPQTSHLSFPSYQQPAYNYTQHVAYQPPIPPYVPPIPKNAGQHPLGLHQQPPQPQQPHPYPAGSQYYQEYTPPGFQPPQPHPFPVPAIVPSQQHPPQQLEHHREPPKDPEHSRSPHHPQHPQHSHPPSRSYALPIQTNMAPAADFADGRVDEDVPSVETTAAAPSYLVEPSPVKTKFPTARIKRIMQADEEVGKVAQQAPIAVGKALELFMVALVTRSAAVAREKNQKRITTHMLKQVVESDEQWDFLQDIVSKVAESEEKPAKGRPPKTGGGAADHSDDSEDGVADTRKRRGRKKKTED